MSQDGKGPFSERVLSFQRWPWAEEAEGREDWCDMAVEQRDISE